MQVAKEWYAAQKVAEHFYRIFEPHASRYLTGNVWMFEGSESVLIIDTGSGMRSLRQFIQGMTDKPIMAVALNCFYDHSNGLHEFDQRLAHAGDQQSIAAPTEVSSVSSEYLRNNMFTQLPEQDYDVSNFRHHPAQLTRVLNDGDTILLDDWEFNVIHTPGVTPGSICLLETKTGSLFTSDVYFHEEGAPSPLPREADVYRNSVRRLMALRFETVYPGHFDSVPAQVMQDWAAKVLQE